MEKFDTQSETGILPGRKGNGSVTTTTVVLVIAIAVSIVAIVLAAVALTKPVGPNVIQMQAPSSGQTAPPPGNARIWTMAVGHDWGAYEYFDDEGYIRGFNLQLSLTVCEEAGMDCRLIWDRYSNCFDSKAGEHPVGGQGLFDRWYDACAGWAVTVGRNHTFAFSESYLEYEKSIFLVEKGNAASFDGSDLAGKKIVFLDGWGYDEKCLARQQDSKHTNYILPKENIIHVGSAEQAVEKLTKKEAVAVFADKNVFQKYTNVEAVPNLEFGCFLDGNSMMTRKDSDFNYYWNIGFRKFRENGGFEALCKKANQEHADHGYVNCKKY